ncbi:MAG TPA: DUF3347 domain-containing protein [Leadbetterella sp.]|nr:DUF3347 domain-containing protein [Leadbetterella sp.]
MRSISTILITTTVLLSTLTNLAFANMTTVEEVRVYGNCEMCEARIEKAGTIKKLAKVNWNKDTKMATITLDSKRTSKDEILRRIALAGHDSDSYLAPDDIYSALPDCCKYQRKSKESVQYESADMVTSESESSNAMLEQKYDSEQLKNAEEGYFLLKDALVKTDGTQAASKAIALLSAMSAIKMEKLSPEEHQVWMKIQKSLTTNVKNISETKDPSKQRSYFISVSKDFYQLIKVSKPTYPVYYQYCPMANNGKGANWLSKEQSVKNPYYGSMMLTCGNTVETIK